MAAARQTQRRPRPDQFRDLESLRGQRLAAGLDALRTLYDSNPDAQSFIYNSVHIKLTGLRRGIQRYEQALAATLGDLLARGGDGYDGRGAWIDAAGLYLARSCMEELLDAIEQGAVTTPEALTERLRAFAEHYDDYARSWALDILARRLGHTPDAAEIERAVVEGKAAQQGCNASRRPTARSTVRSTWLSATDSTPPRTTNAKPTSAPSADWNRET